MNNLNKQLSNTLQQLNKGFVEASITWYPYAGTLLGLVRNGQLIKWDDDIDMIMNHDHLISSKNKIREICNNLGLGVEFHDESLHDVTVITLPRLTVLVDDDSYDFEPKIEIHPTKPLKENENYFMTSVYSSLAGVESWEIYNNIFKYFLLPIRFISKTIIPRQWFDRKIDRRLNDQTTSKFEICIYKLTNTNRFAFDLNQTTILKTKIGEFTIPQNTKHYLNDKYGDWNKETVSTPVHVLNLGKKNRR